MGAVLLSPLYFALIFYLASRALLWLSSLPFFLGSPWFALPFLILLSLAALSPLLSAFGQGKVKAAARTVSGCWLGILLYLLLCVFAVDLFRVLDCLAKGRPLLSPMSENSYRITGGMVLTAVLAVSGFGFLHSFHLKKRHYEIQIAKTCPLPGLRIALVADLHLGGAMGISQAERMAKLIREMRPDLILFAGDLFDNDFDVIRDPERIAALFAGMESTYGSFACWGNHDVSERILAGFTFSTGDRPAVHDRRMAQFLKDSGIRLLEDQALLIDHSFYLCGRLDASCLKKTGILRKTPQELLSALDLAKPVLVMDHQPSQLPELSEAGADLALSGHTHGGQLFPLTLINRIVWPNSWGMREIGAMASIVTSGAGVWGPTMRVGTDSEVVEIDVKFRQPPSLRSL